MFNFTNSLNPKKRLKRAVHSLKELNRNILKDSLWKGRFYAKMLGFQRYFYPDNSGMNFLFKLEFVDLKTGITQIGYFDEYDINTARLFWAMNDFIVMFVNAWQDDPKNDTTVYRSR